MKILYLTHRLPFAPNRGDRIRSYHTLRRLAARFTVEVVSLVHDAEEEAALAGMSALARVRPARVSRWGSRLRGVGALLTGRPLTHALLHSGEVRPALDAVLREGRPDAVLALCSGMARYALEPPLAGLPLVIDVVDVDSAKWAEMGARTRGPMGWIYRREARRLGAFEALSARRAHASTVVNERERAALLALAPEARVEVVPNGVDFEGFRPKGPPSSEPRVVFCGVMSYGPNEEAALWLIAEIWPLVRARRPDALLSIVGMGPTERLRAAAARAAGVEVTGAVPDVRPHLWRAAVAAAPLLLARGVQNKVLEALSAGLPTVITPAVEGGLSADALAGCRVGASAEAVAAEIVDLLGKDPEERRAIAGRADLGGYAWASRAEPICRLLEEAAGRGPR